MYSKVRFLIIFYKNLFFWYVARERERERERGSAKRHVGDLIIIERIVVVKLVIIEFYHSKG